MGHISLSIIDFASDLPCFPVRGLVVKHGVPIETTFQLAFYSCPSKSDILIRNVLISIRVALVFIMFVCLLRPLFVPSLMIKNQSMAHFLLYDHADVTFPNGVTHR